MISILNIPLFSSAAPKKNPKKIQADSKIIKKQTFMQEMRLHLNRISNPASHKTIDSMLHALYDGNHQQFKIAFNQSNKRNKRNKGQYTVYWDKQFLSGYTTEKTCDPKHWTKSSNPNMCINAYHQIILTLINFEKCTPQILQTMLDADIGTDLIQEIFPIDESGLMQLILNRKEFDLYNTIMQHSKTRNAFILLKKRDGSLMGWNSYNPKNIFNLIRKMPHITRSQQSQYLSPLVNLINSLADEEGTDKDAKSINLEKITEVLNSFDQQAQDWLIHLWFASPSFARNWLKARASRRINLDAMDTLITSLDHRFILDFINCLPSYALKKKGPSSKEFIELFTSIIEDTLLLSMNYIFLTLHSRNMKKEDSCINREEYPYDIQLGIQLLTTRNLSQEKIQLYIDLISILMKKIPKEKHYIKTTEDYDQTFSYILSSLKRNSSNPTSKAESIIKNLKETYISIIGEETK